MATATATLYIRTGQNDAPMAVKASGSPMGIVKAARDTIDRIAGEGASSAVFGQRTFNANGNVQASVMERFYASGLRNGEAFACMVGDLAIAGAYSVDDAICAIADVATLREHATAALSV